MLLLCCFEYFAHVLSLYFCTHRLIIAAVFLYALAACCPPLNPPRYKMLRATQELLRRDHKRTTQVAALAGKVAEEKAFVAKRLGAA